MIEGHGVNLHVCAQALEDAKVALGDMASVEVVGGSSRVPALLNTMRDFFKKEPSRTLNATEVVSRGCALNCAMLSPIFRWPPLTHLLPFLTLLFSYLELWSF